jgi:hypothetical protein
MSAWRQGNQQQQVQVQHNMHGVCNNLATL